MFITIGTSAVVYPAAGFIDLARRHGALTVEINPEATPAMVDLALRGGAEDRVARDRPKLLTEHDYTKDTKDTKDCGRFAGGACAAMRIADGEK